MTRTLLNFKLEITNEKLTQGIVKKLLTSSPTHPHGIKVMLTSKEVGRVQEILQ